MPPPPPLSLPFFWWMSPVILGLLLAVRLAMVTSSAAIGKAMRSLGLLVIPEERIPTRIACTEQRLVRLVLDYRCRVRSGADVAFTGRLSFGSMYPTLMMKFFAQLLSR